MNDLDDLIRAELERFVPVTGQPDWSAVRTAASATRTPLAARRRQLLVVALVALVIVGTAVAAVTQAPWWQRGSHPTAVLEDVYRDGKLGHEWNCRSLRAAIRKLPEDVVRYSHVGEPVFAASQKRCAAALATIAPGTSKAAVRATLGAPTAVIGGCWVYSWKPLRFEPARYDAHVCFQDHKSL